MIQHRVGVIAGAFNPVTRAHLALADAARQHVDEIVFAIPRAFPHKEYTGASLDDRIEMIARAAGHPVHITEGGLYLDIAREVRRARRASHVHIVCGRDAAERVLTWNYDDPQTLPQMFEEFQLLVADRQGTFEPPEHLRHRIQPLAVPAEFDDVSSSEVRRRLAEGANWEHLVPESIVELIRKIYQPKA